MPPNSSLHPLLTRLRTAIRRHNEAATSLSTLQAENMLLNPKARHMPPSSPMELPTMSALKAENRAAVKLRREVRGILKTTGIMAQEIARLGPENRVIRLKGGGLGGGMMGEGREMTEGGLEGLESLVSLAKQAQLGNASR